MFSSDAGSSLIRTDLEASRRVDERQAQELAAEQLLDDMEVDPLPTQPAGATAVAQNAQPDDKAANADAAAAALLRQQLQEEQERASMLKAKLRNRSSRQRAKSTDALSKALRIKYPALQFEPAVLEFLVSLAMDDAEASAQAERQFAILQNDPSVLTTRDRIVGTKVDEIGYGKEGRLYVQREGSVCRVVRIGNKKTQKRDIEWIRQR